MGFFKQLRKELVLSFKYKRTRGKWKQVQKLPEIVRLTNQDCSQQFQEPKLFGSLAHAFVDLRVYDERGINITDGVGMLGEWDNAKVRCEAFLDSILKTTPGHEKESIIRSV